jgi:hypothetical protein
MVVSQEIQMQDVHHAIQLDSKLDRTSNSLVCDAESMPKGEASVDHVYMDPWCTYYELSINLGPSWWNQHGNTFGCFESDENNGLRKIQPVCSWTVHRRSVLFQIKTLAELCFSILTFDG